MNSDTYQLDETDRRILLALDADPRVPIMMLAQQLGLARGTVQTRLERLAHSGALRPNTARILPAAMGRGVSAFVSGTAPDPRSAGMRCTCRRYRPLDSGGRHRPR